MTGQTWTLDDIPWDRFEAAKVDREMLRLVKAASLVEANGGDYATYLCNVFPDDPEFQQAARHWAAEEVQHGRALARWAALADPDFDFEASFKKFTAGYSLPLDAAVSVRGSRSGELVARCIVAVGTSSYYTALKEAADEPVLQEICRRIAADELRHYKLFYSHLKRYLAKEGVGKVRRVLVVLGRMGESEDDELAYAYYAANGGTEAYDRRRWSRAYLARAYSFYRRHHIDRVVAMSLKAAGLNPQSPMAGGIARLGYWFTRTRCRRALAAEA